MLINESRKEFGSICKVFYSRPVIRKYSIRLKGRGGRDERSIGKWPSRNSGNPN
jgi:hypothetical protein